MYQTYRLNNKLYACSKSKSLLPTTKALDSNALKESIGKENPETCDSEKSNKCRKLTLFGNKERCSRTLTSWACLGVKDTTGNENYRTLSNTMYIHHEVTCRRRFEVLIRRLEYLKHKVQIVLC